MRNTACSFCEGCCAASLSSSCLATASMSSTALMIRFESARRSFDPCVAATAAAADGAALDASSSAVDASAAPASLRTPLPLSRKRSFETKLGAWVLHDPLYGFPTAAAVTCRGRQLQLPAAFIDSRSRWGKGAPLLCPPPAIRRPARVAALWRAGSAPGSRARWH